MSWKDSSGCIHEDLTGDVFSRTMGTMPGRGGGGTTLYKPCRYVPPQRVGFLYRLV